MVSSKTGGQLRQQILDGLKSNQCENDPWGNPYQVFVDELDSIPPTKHVGVFSFGEDGISNSRGNDPDDISSWRPMSEANFYQRKNLNLRNWFLLRSFLISLPLMAAFLVARRFLKDSERPLDGYRSPNFFNWFVAICYGTLATIVVYFTTFFCGGWLLQAFGVLPAGGRAVLEPERLLIWTGLSAFASIFSAFFVVRYYLRAVNSNPIEPPR